MIRALLDEFLLFLLPFAAFALLLVLQRRHVLRVESWSGRTLHLVVVGLVLAIGALLLEGILFNHHQGRYVPPHMENGRPVPGTFR